MNFDDHTKVLFKATAKECFAVGPIANGLIGLLCVWGSYAIVTSGVFGAVSDLPRWATASATLLIMQMVSVLAILIISVKSLVPAVVLWIIGIALIYVGSPLAPVVLAGAFVSALLFRVFSSR